MEVIKESAETKGIEQNGHRELPSDIILYGSITSEVETDMSLTNEEILLEIEKTLKAIELYKAHNNQIYPEGIKAWPTGNLLHKKDEILVRKNAQIDYEIEAGRKLTVLRMQNYITRSDDLRIASTRFQQILTTNQASDLEKLVVMIDVELESRQKELGGAKMISINNVLAKLNRAKVAIYNDENYRRNINTLIDLRDELKMQIRIDKMASLNTQIAWLFSKISPIYLTSKKLGRRFIQIF